MSNTFSYNIFHTKYIQTALAGTCPTYEKQKNTQEYFVLIADLRNLGRPQLRYRDMCKQDIKERIIYLNKWE